MARDQLSSPVEKRTTRPHDELLPIFEDESNVSHSGFNAGDASPDGPASLVRIRRFSRPCPKPRTIPDVDLDSLVARLEAGLRDMTARHVDVVLRRGAPLAQIRAETAELEVVLLTLALDVRDAMPQDGRLTIETTEAVADLLDRSLAASRYVVLSIGDGATMSSRPRPRERLLTPASDAVGLDTVCRIVGRLGGRVFVARAPGSAPTFRVYLPTKARG